MLQHFGVTPYLVFDGAYLPSKAGTEASRAKNREESRRRGMELLKAGKAREAEKEFQKAVDVTPEMARNLIEELKRNNVAYVVAPYEADSQLVYLEREGIIDGIVSEDSDLLVFGAKRLITKLTKYGECIEINRRDFAAVREVSLTGWTDADFRRMAILSGCDYLDGIHDVGLKTAYRLIRKHKTPERIVKMLQFEGKHRISENYLTEFFRAELTFLHQRVYCPKKKELVLLTEADPQQGVEDMPFIGAFLEPELARAVAVGDVNPITKEPMGPPELTPSKRRHSQSAQRAAAARPSQPGKPIDSYFKGKGNHRIPMGEMDRNCFSVDPQRIAAITQNGLVPRVFPLPRPYLDEATARPEIVSPRRSASASLSKSPRLARRRTEPMANLLSPLLKPRPSPTRRKSAYPTTEGTAAAIDGRQNQASTFKEGDDLQAAVEALMAGGGQRPSKKIRLCADTEADGNGRQGVERSKWFSKPARAKKSDGYLMSDSSIDEALLNLPDVEGWHSTAKPRDSISIFEEGPQVARVNEIQTTVTQTTETQTTETQITETQITETETTETQITETTVTTESQASSGFDAIAETPPSDFSFTVPDGPDAEEIVSQASVPDTPVRASIHQFAYQKPTTRAQSSSRRASMIPTPSTLNSRRGSAIFTPAISTPSTAPSTAASRMTPLQRIGAQAFHRRNLPGSPVRPVGSKPISGLAGSRPVNPSFVPLPKVDLAEVEALNRQCGSEDQMIPDSEGEDNHLSEDVEGDDEGSGEYALQRVPGMDLSRFAFSS